MSLHGMSLQGCRPGGVCLRAQVSSFGNLPRVRSSGSIAGGRGSSRGVGPGAIMSHVESIASSAVRVADKIKARPNDEFMFLPPLTKSGVHYSVLLCFFKTYERPLATHLCCTTLVHKHAVSSRACTQKEQAAPSGQLPACAGTP